MKLFSITGPESSGKSALAAKLANHYNTYWVPETARAYLASLDRPYIEEDLSVIAVQQLKAEEVTIKRAKQANKPFVFCDTDFLVLKIWSEFKYGRSSSIISTLWQQHRYVHSLLMFPDLPWQPDPQREHPQQRMRLFNLYESTLKVAKAPYTIIKGIGEERSQAAIKVVESLN